MGNYRKVSYDRVCEYCGKQFIAHDKRKRFCSKKCASISERLRKGIPCNTETEPYHKNCLVCGKLFDTFREAQHTCSSECAKEWHSKIRHRNVHVAEQMKLCLICGKPFFSAREDRILCGDIECEKARKKDRSKTWKKPQKQKAQITYKTTECVVCGIKFEHDSRQTRKYCSKDCAKKAESKRHDKRIPKNQRVDNIILERLYDRDRGECYKCGCKCDFTDWKTSKRGNKYPGETYPTIDHLVPVSRGGLDAWDNVKLACWKCNIEKADKLETVEPMDKSFAYSKQSKGQQPKRTAQYTLDGKLVRVWESTAQIRRETGLSDKHIQNVCRRNKSNTGNAYGYHWEYVNEQNARCG